ncbi:MAG: hypothetical protein AAFN93_10865 [Bacteroidota bacterium]
MKEKTEEQIGQWLKKLQRESWQLELLVSAFTIFLLIAAQKNFGEFIVSLIYEFYGPVGFLIFFLSLIQASIIALTAFLIIHLLLRGFWIGAIGLRSVQPNIDYSRLNYSEFFEDRLKKKLIGLDRLVVILDELCSVIFSVSFLIIFMIISFGLYFLFLGFVSGALVFIAKWLELEFAGLTAFIFTTTIILVILSGIIYLIDYFTLGFFKKFKRFSKIYYPIYRFYSTITLSVISRSIYYNLISKYSKKRIRLLLSSLLIILLSTSFISFDQYPFFPEGDDDLILENNYYDDLRDKSEYIDKVSVESKFINTDFVSLFIRYIPSSNERIQSNCPDFKPMKNDGINPTFKFTFDSGMQISNQKFEEEDKEMLLDCLQQYYEVSINDSVYSDLKYYFHEHPVKKQRGILTVFPSDHFKRGENIISVKTNYIDPSDSLLVSEDYARVPIWVHK